MLIKRGSRKQISYEKINSTYLTNITIGFANAEKFSKGKIISTMGNSKPDLLKQLVKNNSIKSSEPAQPEKIKLTSDDKKKNTHSTFHDLFGNKRKAGP